MSRKLFFSCMFLSVLVFSSLVVSVDAASMWSRTYGGTGNEEAYSLVETSDGGYALAGYTTSFCVGGNFWLVKTDAVGNMEWSRAFGGTSSDSAYSLVATSDGGYAIAGYTNSFGAGGGDFYLVKTDVGGNMEWNKTYGGAGTEIAYSLVATSDGGYAIAGTWNLSKIPVLEGWNVEQSDFWLVKTDAFGNMQWNQTYGGAAPEIAYSLVATSDGGYAIAGTGNYVSYVGGNFWLVKTDANGNMEWNQTYGGSIDGTFYFASSLVATSDGGYAITGYTNSFEEGAGGNFWFVKTDAFGNMQWNQTYVNPSAGTFFFSIDPVSSLVETTGGGYVIAGSTGSFDTGNSDFWLVKTTASGNMEWNQTYGGTGVDFARLLVLASDGGYAIAGSTWPSGSGADFWLVKTDEFGVVPEYSSWLVPALVLTATAFIIISKKRLLQKRSLKS